MKIVLRWAVLAVSVGACAHASSAGPTTARVPPRDLTGCYALRATKRLYYAPPQLRLNADTISRETRLFLGDSTLAAWTVSRLEADGRPMEARRSGMLYWWRHPASDSLGVMIHTGHSGTELTVRPTASADTLRGNATEHWDVGPPFSNPGGAVSLARVPCPGEPSST